MLLPILLLLLLLHPLVLEQQLPLLTPPQLHPQPPPRLSSARPPLVDSGPVRLPLSAHHLDLLLSQQHPLRLQPLEPNPTPPLSLVSRTTPHLYLGQLLILQQVEAFSLEEPAHLEPQTTPQVCLLLERDQQPLLPTPPWHPRQEHLEVDSALHNLRSISGQQSRSQPLLLDHNLLLGVRSRQQ